MSLTTTKPRYMGQSSDKRTNVWMITCPACGKDFQPTTTLRATQYLDCPRAKCQAEMRADYNAEPPVVTLLNKVK